MAICPAGHTSTADDYCDICGLPVSSGGGSGTGVIPPVVAGAAPAGALCPNCGTTNAPDALFCEACGYDFTTGTMPRSAASPSSNGWASPAGSQSPSDPAGGSEAENSEGRSNSPVPQFPRDASLDASIEGGSSPQGWPTPGIQSSEAAPAAPGDPATDASPATPDNLSDDVTPAPGTQVISAHAGISEHAQDDEPWVDERDNAAAAPAGGRSQDEQPLVAPSPAAAPAPTPPSRRPLQVRPTSVEWVAEIWIDPDWYATQGSSDALPSPGLPDVVPLRASSALIGRTSRSRNIHPDIDCALDSGVSRRHAQVTSDGSRWWIEDLESANGTFIGPSAGPLPTDPIGRGRVEFTPDQRIYLGAWTRIVIRAATDDEKQAFNA